MKVYNATFHPWIVGLATPRFLRVTCLHCYSDVMAVLESTALVNAKVLPLKSWREFSWLVPLPGVATVEIATDPKSTDTVSVFCT